jgi:hypothetical protein
MFLSRVSFYFWSLAEVRNTFLGHRHSIKINSATRTKKGEANPPAHIRPTQFLHLPAGGSERYWEQFKKTDGHCAGEI